MLNLTAVWDGLWQTLDSPQRLHAALVHVPIGAGVVGAVLAFALAIRFGKSAGLRWALVWVYLIGFTGAWLAHESGEKAEHAVGASLSPAAEAVLHEHEEMGELVHWLMLAPLGLGLATMFKTALIRWPAMVLCFFAAVGVLGWVGVVGHHGGTLVYQHGVGVPSTPNNLSASPPSDERGVIERVLPRLRDLVTPSVGGAGGSSDGERSSDRDGSQPAHGGPGESSAPPPREPGRRPLFE